MNASPSDAPAWSIRKYRDGDEEQIRKLRGLVLSGAKDSQWWKWFYKDNPAGPALIWLAETDNEIIGHVAHVPIRMKIGNQEVIGAFGVDSMTHPDYQHRGILKKLQEKIAESSVEQGLCFSFGACLSHIMKIYKKLRITEICQQHLIVKITFWGKFLKKRFGIPCLLGNIIGYIWDIMATRTSLKNSENIEVIQIFRFEQNINEFWHKASIQKQIMVVRDMEYLNWRYFEKPGHPYKVFIAKREDDVVGYIVFQQGKIEATAGLILDLFTLPDDNVVMEALIRKAITYFKEKGVLIIYCFMLPNTQYYPVLKRFGFIHRDSDLHFDIDIYNKNISKKFVTNPQNWYFVRGDTDVS